MNRYEILTGMKLDDPSLREMQNVESLMKSVEAQNESFKSFRKKKQAIFQGADLCLKPVSLVGDIAAGGSSVAFPPSSLIFGAVSLLIGAAHGVSDSYDAIIDLFGTLQVRHI